MNMGIKLFLFFAVLEVVGFSQTTTIGFRADIARIVPSLPHITVLQTNDVSEEDSVFEPTVLANGDSLVMYYSQGWSHPHTSVAISSNGLDWIKQGIVVSNSFRNCAVKFNGTTYLYVANSQTNTNIDVYTSTSMTNNFVKQGVAIASTAGTWDANILENSDVYIDSETNWAMWYEARATAGGQWKIGMATSSNGLSWTKYTNNPVVSLVGPIAGPSVVKVGNSFVMFNCGNLATNLPSDIFRYTSTDKVNWAMSDSGVYIRRIGAEEGETNQVGQVADPFYFRRGTTNFLYFSASSDGSRQAGNQHIRCVLDTGEGLLP